MKTLRTFYNVRNQFLNNSITFYKTGIITDTFAAVHQCMYPPTYRVCGEYKCQFISINNIF